MRSAFARGHMFLFIWGALMPVLLCASGWAATQQLWTLKNVNGDNVALIDGHGHLVLKGQLTQNLGSTIDTSALSSKWQQKDATGLTVVACVDLTAGATSGDLKLKGALNQNATITIATGDLLRLKNASGNYVAVIDASGNLNIAGSLYESQQQVLPVVIVQFTQTAINVTEGTANIQLSIVLSESTNRAISLFCSTADATASAGRDYVGLSQTVTFAAGETQKTVTIDILNNLLSENSETFEVSLTNLDWALLGAASPCVVTIADDADSFVMCDAY